MEQVTGLSVRMTATGVEAVRGVQVVCRAQLAEGVTERDVRAAFRARYADEPFVRVVAHQRGTYRLPEPKILAGSNYCDVGFVVDEKNERVIAIGALDNLVKGGAGNAVQCLNTRRGWPERLGLEFPACTWPDPRSTLWRSRQKQTTHARTRTQASSSSSAAAMRP